MSIEMGFCAIIRHVLPMEHLDNEGQSSYSRTTSDAIHLVARGLRPSAVGLALGPGTDADPGWLRWHDGRPNRRHALADDRRAAASLADAGGGRPRCHAAAGGRTA